MTYLENQMKKLNERQFKKANLVIIYYFYPLDQTSIADHHHTVSEKNYDKIVLLLTSSINLIPYS